MLHIQYQRNDRAPTIDTAAPTTAAVVKLHRAVLIKGLYQTCFAYQFDVVDTFPTSPTAPYRRLA
jgi:hypothetical protein